MFISDNVFENCGDLQINGQAAESGEAVTNSVLRNNFVTNGRLVVQDCARLSIEGNHFIVETDHADYTAWTSSTTGQNAFWLIEDCDELLIANNRLIGDRDYNQYARHGILILQVAKRRVATVTVDYWYAQKMHVHGNTIANFQYGLSTINANHRLSVQTAEWVNSVWENNIVSEVRDSAHPNGSVGICVPPGVVCRNNLISRDVDAATTKSVASTAPPIENFSFDFIDNCMSKY